MQEFTGMQYLKIDIANHYGLDKKSWNERLDWFDKNESNLLNLVKEADEPAEFYAGCKAYEQAKAGNPIGYPIALDATASGSQWLSCLIGDSVSAKLCNVIGTGKREDIYTIIYRKLCERTGIKANIEREQVKKAIMTANYGSEERPKKVFGEKVYDDFVEVMKENMPEVWDLNTTFLEIWNSKAIEYGWVMPDNFHVHYKVKKGITENVNLFNKPYEIFRTIQSPVKQGRMHGANVAHSIDSLVMREMIRRCNYNERQINYVRRLVLWASLNKSTVKERIRIEATQYDLSLQLLILFRKTKYLSARVLDTLTKGTIGIWIDNLGDIIKLIDSLPKKPFEVIGIHDCFRCLPNYGNDLRKQYVNQLALIADSNLLQHILDAIAPGCIVNKADPNMGDKIRATSEYALS